MNVTPYAVAQRFIGLREIEGSAHHPLIQWGFLLCGYGTDTPDEVAWCSAIMQVPPYVLGLPRSGSAAARSWLQVGEPIEIGGATRGFDVVVLNRGNGPQDPSVIRAPGHVGWYVRHDERQVWLLGGNQADAFSIAPFPLERVLGVRRLA